MNSDALLALMHARRSVRRFGVRQPSRTVLAELVAAAISAPSASNKQPWRFFVATRPARITAMAEAVQMKIDALLPQLDPTAADHFAAYGRYFVRFADAPVVMTVACRPLQVLSHLASAQTPPVAQADIALMERNAALVSTSLAVQNMMLYAHSIGLGTSCLAGPLLAATELKALLGIPSGWELACLVAVGYPDDEPENPGRKSPEGALRWLDPQEP